MNVNDTTTTNPPTDLVAIVDRAVRFDRIADMMVLFDRVAEDAIEAGADDDIGGWVDMIDAWRDVCNAVDVTPYDVAAYADDTTDALRFMHPRTRHFAREMVALADGFWSALFPVELTGRS